MVCRVGSTTGGAQQAAAGATWCQKEVEVLTSVTVTEAFKCDNM